jgi:hypothetical protein
MPFFTRLVASIAKEKVRFILEVYCLQVSDAGPSEMQEFKKATSD